MLKLITLLLGLIVGFSGGMYYGVHHPEDASRLSDLEQQKLLELKIQATEAVKAQLDKKIADSAKPAGGLGFLNSNKTPAQALTEVRDQQDQDLQQMRAQLAQMKKK